MAQADRTLENGIGGVTYRLRRFREGAAGAEPGAGAKRRVRQVEGDLVALGDEIEDFDGFDHDFRADSITVEQGDFVSFHENSGLVKKARKCSTSYVLPEENADYSGYFRRSVKCFGRSEKFIHSD
jgi:hypothetical protein